MSEERVCLPNFGPTTKERDGGQPAGGLYVSPLAATPRYSSKEFAAETAPGQEYYYKAPKLMQLPCLAPRK